MPHKVIFDSTVISNFLLCNAGPLIAEYYTVRGIITQEVYEELSAGVRKYPAIRLVDDIIGHRKFTLITLSKKEHESYRTLLDSLGRGEASCIAFANHTGGVVATDDMAARKICNSYNIPVSGTIGILIALCRNENINIDLAETLLLKMIHAGFYSPIRLIRDVI